MKCVKWPHADYFGLPTLEPEHMIHRPLSVHEHLTIHGPESITGVIAKFRLKVESDEWA